MTEPPGPSLSSIPEGEIARLRAELTAMQQTLELERQGRELERQGRHRRSRKAFGAVISVLAIIALTAALANLWTWRTLTNTDKFVARVGPIIEQPQVVATLSAQVSEAIVDGLALQERLKGLLPEQAAPLSGPIASSAENFIESTTADLLQTDQFRAAWDSALRISHQAAVQVLQGKSTGAITVTDGEVTLNILPLINEVLGTLESFVAELVGRDINLPSVTEDNVQQAIAALESQFGVDLPDDYGQVVLFTSDQLAMAQDLYQIGSILAWLLPIVGILLLVLAVVLAERRGRRALIIIAGTAAGLLFVGLALAPLQSAIVAQVAEKGMAGAVSASFETVFSSLRTAIGWAVVLGVAAGLALFVTGRSAASAKTREAAGKVPAAAVKYRPLFIGGGVVAAVLVLAMWPGRSLAQFALVILALGAYLLAVFLAPSSEGESGG